jgi:ABC-type transporter Mla MlaB component
MSGAAERSATLAIRAPLQREDLPGLFARTCALLQLASPQLLSVEVAQIEPDAVAVDALARLALAARRHGCAVQLRGASPQLELLIELIGLADALPSEVAAAPVRPLGFAMPVAAAARRTAGRASRSRGRT